MTWWMTFNQLRKDHKRTWHRRADILDELRRLGCPWHWYEVSMAFVGIPKPEKRYGHYRYTAQHMEAAVAAWRTANGG